MIAERIGGGVVIPRQGGANVSRNVVLDEASSWWPLEKSEIEDTEKNKEEVHGKSQENTCILSIAIDRE